ncbi:MAG: DUF1992 domain-containing protein [Acidimicrobiia bacterium]|nr:DUF1992 domain-containing protein [Acidimicrobiia bacterium]
MEEPWIERVIREAQESGKFDDAAGVGQPIPDIDRPYDPAWWARRWLVRERYRENAAELARNVVEEIPRILAGTVESEVRAGLESLNTRIEAHNEVCPSGNALPRLDVAGLLKEWAVRRDR